VPSSESDSFSRAPPAQETIPYPAQDEICQTSQPQHSSTVLQSTATRTFTPAPTSDAAPVPSPHYDPMGRDFTIQRLTAQSIAKTGPSFWPKSDLDLELDEAFLGLGIKDADSMNPALDYTSKTSPGPQSAKDFESLTPPEERVMTEDDAGAPPGVRTAKVGAVRRMLGKARLARELQSGTPATSTAREFVRAVTPAAQTGTITFRADLKKQTMIGVGYSNAFYTNYWHTAHPYSKEIYNYMLPDLRPSMLRIRNHYGIGEDANIVIDREFLNLASQLLGYKPTTLITSWSPPASLKASGRLNGANPNPNVPITDVLAKDSNGNFRYADYAKYWVDSLKAYAAIGVNPDYFRYGLRSFCCFIVMLTHPFFPLRC
jgi:hypothetical protein